MKKRNRIPSANTAAINICIILITIVLLFINNNATAQSSKWIAPKDADNVKNPVTANAASLKEGKTLYTSYCVPCHGEKGKGDGVAAAALSVKPADHSSAYVQNQTDGALFWELSEGHNPMPSYKTAFNEAQRWELINYIRTLAKTQKK
ncbi:cytochrome c [Panacibacter ginsenosidivorans]|uniref:Cytochrome c n=1 Tax=Panacibacter ginsenosidivorans TaxID=1813871 RepID=A0A5B8VEM7_9BACT|nr:cytochrome c [Panacibacter ginsenosidivorans]QEC69515.1 cytochrome c [Panacibacter ginsenosidivorans]